LLHASLKRAFACWRLTFCASTWTWQSCEKTTCKQLVFADSLNPVSAPDFRFTAAMGQKMSSFRASIARLAQLPCDLIVPAHPGLSQLFDHAAAGTLLQSKSCFDYANDAAQRVDARVQSEQSAR
jgi:metallo-beta-lactamase class B